MTIPLPKQGLYAITADGMSESALLAAVAAAIEGGAVMLQYRDKSRALPEKQMLARRLCELCHGRNIPLIVNDDIALAALVGADGVHLGKDDAAIGAARSALGPGAIIGVSCYDNLELARRAQILGASYAAFGRFFPSSSKPNATPASSATLQQAKQELHIPLAAIGGITPANGAPLVAAGADFLCAIDGLFGQSDPRQAAQCYAALFRHGSTATVTM